MTPDLPLTPDERRQIRARLELGGGGIPLVEGHEVVMRLLATADALETECAHLRATVCQVPDVAQCAQLWEADHQQRVLQGLGLAEEFPFGCDAIEQVAVALVAARQALEQARADCTAALKRLESYTILMDKAGHLIDQLECLALPDYPSLYEGSKSIRQELQARRIQIHKVPLEEQP